MINIISPLLRKCTLGANTYQQKYQVITMYEIIENRRKYYLKYNFSTLKLTIQ